MPEQIFTLRVNGTPWVGWKKVEVSRSIERMAGEFSIHMTNIITAGLTLGFKVGDSCSVEIDDQVILDGYIDEISDEFDSRSAIFSVSGRDKTGDLIDCAASVDGPFEFNDQTLDQILRTVLKPYNIPLSINADAGKAFSRLAIQPGETAFELVERLCRYRSLLPLSDGIGGLVVTKPGSEKSAGRIVYGENALSGGTSRQGRDRFSLYVAKGQAEALSFSTAEETAQPEGRATDDLVGRYRPKLITGENASYDLTLQERANWEKQFARARAIQATYTVQGWYANGKEALWKPNTLVWVKDTRRELDREMLIVGVQYIRDESGTKTRLDLTIPEAFDLPAEKDPETDDLWGDA